MLKNEAKIFLVVKILPAHFITPLKHFFPQYSIHQFLLKKLTRVSFLKENHPLR